MVVPYRNIASLTPAQRDANEREEDDLLSRMAEEWDRAVAAGEVLPPHLCEDDPFGDEWIGHKTP